MRSSFFCLAPLLALVACTDSDPDLEPDDDPTARTVTAHEALTFRGADGATTDRAVDLDRAVIQATVQAADGAWHVVPGEGTSGGDVIVAGVPAGPGYVRVDYHDASAEPQPRNEYFWIGIDPADPAPPDLAIELGTWQLGRTDIEWSQTAPTTLALEVAGFAPWQPGFDLLVVYVPNIGFVNVFDSNIPDSVEGMPAEAATDANIKIDWVTALSGPLVNASRGDRGYLMQFRFVERDGIFVGAPVRAAAMPEFTLTDGDATGVTAALAEPTPLQVRLAMDRAAFDALRPEISPEAGAASGRGFAVSASPTPVGEDFSLGSVPAELVVLDELGLDGTGLFDLGDLDLASPFPAANVYGRFVSVYPVPIERDDGVVAIGRAEIGALTPSLPTQAAPAAPIIGPVRAPTIGGVDAFSAPQGVGLTPEIAWQPPVLGTPSEYEVRILAPGGADPTYDYIWYPAAIFHVPGDRTSLTIPPEVLLPDFPYAVAIRAISQPLAGAALAAAPRHLALPYGWADTITPAFKP